MSFPTVDCLQNGIQLTIIKRLKFVMIYLMLPLLGLGLPLIMLIAGFKLIPGNQSANAVTLDFDRTQRPLKPMGAVYTHCFPPPEASRDRLIPIQCFSTGVFFSPDTGDCYSVIILPNDPRPQISLTFCNE